MPDFAPADLLLLAQAMGHRAEVLDDPTTVYIRDEVEFVWVCFEPHKNPAQAWECAMWLLGKIDLREVSKALNGNDNSERQYNLVSACIAAAKGEEGK